MRSGRVTRAVLGEVVPSRNDTVGRCLGRKERGPVDGEYQPQPSPWPNCWGLRLATSSSNCCIQMSRRGLRMLSVATPECSSPLDPVVWDLWRPERRASCLYLPTFPNGPQGSLCVDRTSVKWCQHRPTAQTSPITAGGCESGGLVAAIAVVVLRQRAGPAHSGGRMWFGSARRACRVRRGRRGPAWASCPAMSCPAWAS